MLQPSRLPIEWPNVVFLAVVHLVGVLGAATYVAMAGVTWPVVALAAAWTVLTIFGISAGYHRLFSHRTYEAHPLFRLFLLAFGAAAFQNSVLAWAADHRRHHARTDSDLDPYDSRRGFWHAHVGWVLRKPDPTIPTANVSDLEADRWIRWQHRHHQLLGAVVGFLLPALLGLLVGDLWGGLLLGGFARLVFVYQVTFAVNSLAHKFGSQPYSDRDSARDSFLAALVTMGEGYHNFHHTFPGDYRNGVRRYQFDPTKWILSALSTVGVTRNLRRTPAPAVIRARVRMEERRLERAGVLPGRASEALQSARAAVDEALGRWNALLKRYEAARREAEARCSGALGRLRDDCVAARADVREALARWRRTAPLA
jgi:stearoyl-CoA desaturase (delta-9 desaturase)